MQPDETTAGDDLAPETLPGLLAGEELDLPIAHFGKVVAALRAAVVRGKLSANFEPDSDRMKIRFQVAAEPNPTPGVVTIVAPVAGEGPPLEFKLQERPKPGDFRL